MVVVCVRELAEEYRWKKYQATAFVLSDAVPRIETLQGKADYRLRTPPALSRITLEVDPARKPVDTFTKKEAAKFLEAATLLLAQGLPARVIMETLGHSQISLTMNTYSHVTAELQRGAADAMDGLLGGK